MPQDGNMVPFTKRIATGTPGLDEMLRGGLIPGRIYLVVGPPGSGKSMLSAQFLMDGANRGENVLMVAMDEHPSEIRENFGQLYGPSFDNIRVIDGMLEMKSYERTPVRDVSIQRFTEPFGKVFPEIARSADLRNPELTASAIQEMIKKEVQNSKTTRIVIDSVTAMKYFLLTEGDRNQLMQSFCRFLSDLQVTVLLTIHENPDLQHPHFHAIDVERVMSRGIISLHQWLQNNGFRLGITVQKFRGSEHDPRMWKVKIDKNGLQVLEDKRRRRRSGK